MSSSHPSSSSQPSGPGPSGSPVRTRTSPRKSHPLSATSPRAAAASTPTRAAGGGAAAAAARDDDTDDATLGAAAAGRASASSAARRAPRVQGSTSTSTAPGATQSQSQSQSQREAKERAERAMLERQVTQLESEVSRLRSDVQRERSSRRRRWKRARYDEVVALGEEGSAVKDAEEAFSQSAERLSAHQADVDIEQLLAQADDAAITSILTSSPLALLSLLGPSAKPHAHAIGLASSSASYSILGPPVQAGGVPLSDAGDDVQTRLEKTKEALKAQSDFARIALISVQTADISPKQRSLDIEYRLPLARTKSSSPSRSSRGLKLRLDIADAQSRRPQVTKMSILTLDRSIRASLGDDVLRIWESSGNVVALLIALRTRVGLVDARSALFDSLSNARPELVKRSGRREEERLIFTGAKDGQLILHFRIEHSRHGVASAVVSLDPVLPFGVRGSASKNLLQALPDMFRELLDAAPPGPDRILQSVLAVVDAFFDQH